MINVQLIFFKSMSLQNMLPNKIRFLHRLIAPKLYTPNMFESGIFPPLPYLRLKLECFLFSLKCICFISLRLLKKKWIHEKHFFLFMHHNINWYFCVHLCNRKNKKYSTLRFVHFNISNTEVQCWIRSGFFSLRLYRKTIYVVNNLASEHNGFTNSPTSSKTITHG